MTRAPSRPRSGTHPSRHRPSIPGLSASREILPKKSSGEVYRIRWLGTKKSCVAYLLASGDANKTRRASQNREADLAEVSAANRGLTEEVSSGSPLCVQEKKLQRSELYTVDTEAPASDPKKWRSAN